MNTTIQHIHSVLGLTGNLFSSTDLINQIQIDSRRIKSGIEDLFVAIKTDKADGHLYIRDAFQKGCRNFLVEDLPSHPLEANFLVVDNTISALQKLAQKHRERFQKKVVGITGSNGKTIVKEWLTELLSKDFLVYQSPGSFNSQIGVPLSLLGLSSEQDLAVIEAGISTIGEMSNLAKMIQCDVGIFTNLGEAHSSGFKDKKEKLEEKLKLFPPGIPIVFCADDQVVSKKIKKGPWTIISWSRKDNAARYGVQVENGDSGFSKVTIKGGGKIQEYQVPFTDEANLENAIHALITAKYLGLGYSSLRSAAEELHPVQMRLSLHQGKNRNLLIQDYYNADLFGLKVALGFMDQHAGQLNKVLILSDLLGSHQDRNLFSQVSQIIADYGIEKVVGIGEEIQHINTEIDVEFFPDTNSFLESSTSQEITESIILLKGSRNFKFEKIFDALVAKTHRPRLEINLRSLKENLDVIRRLVNPPTRLMVMVKAGAYGGGSAEISKLLQSEKVDHLCVAYPDEGIELRKAGIQLPIMVLNPEIDRIEDLIRFQLEPEVYSFRLLDSLSSRANQLPGVHIKLDTGMHRLGFAKDEWDDLASILSKIPGIQIKSVFTHLAASEDPSKDDFSRNQIHEYLRGYDLLCSSLGYAPLKHVLNSSGIHRFPEYHFDIVRLGLGLYGYSPIPDFASQLSPVFSFIGQIAQIKRVKAGETVGYGGAGIVGQDTWVGVVNLGYADGFLRTAGKGRHQVWINGQLYPTLGNICMDMFMLDLGSQTTFSPGQEVVLFSPEHPIEKLAMALDTIPYEVLTNISPRVPRIYIQD
ncbi:MAG: bifunctional UDP-N-acetylmuramoyl-tripeptide:D-alanyl-D-alanine ligase/alanine racemase [Saprospiraceae bacterium]|nr:bifunctional UDP-N-acetylmuramoyl-tripeptide:D-alanyl-D-alanine ligase/alanine racemase [Saprospiraceae bacterium]